MTLSSEKTKEEYKNNITSEILNFKSLFKTSDNSMLKANPSLWECWHFEKNNKININIYEATKGSSKKVWWTCTSCTSDYDMPINKKVNGRGCPYCVGYRVNHTNSLSSRLPNLASQWHPTKNGDLKPHQIVCGNTQKVWWIGECGHEWEANTHNRVYGKTTCPYCIHNPKVLIGFNDLWTTHPHIAQLLKNPELGYSNTFGSSTKVNWKCADCKNENTSTIHSLHRRGAKCKKCSDSLSLGEKIIYSLLKKKEIDFSHEVSLSWSNDKRYDFYIPSLSMIIEVHGEQHYIKSNRGKRSLIEEKENDILKEKLAKSNNIQNYIVVNARNSTMDWIIKSIMESDLKNIFKLDCQNFEELDLRHNLLTLEAWNYWNSGLRVMQISEVMKISKNAVLRYLKIGVATGFCDYKVENRYEKVKKSILKVDSEKNIISKYASLKEASEEVGSYIKPNKAPFAKVLRSKGYYWIYEDEFLEYKEMKI